MSQNTKKPYDLPDWPAEAEQTQEAPRPRRKRRAPAEPEDLWGKLRFRAGKKVRWFGRRCRRVVREAQAHRFPESNRKPLQFLLMLWGLLPSAASRLREILLGRRRERNLRTSRFAVWFEKEKRLHSLMFLGGSCALAGIILFCSFFTIGTTVSYDGQVLGRLASNRKLKPSGRIWKASPPGHWERPTPSTIPCCNTIPAGCSVRTLRIRPYTRTSFPMRSVW